MWLNKFNQGRVPAARLLRRGNHEMYALIHFGLNTYTNREWGYGDEDPAKFDPSDFDAAAIVRACRDGGLTGLILVCKHHDGFCLWPTATTTHNITRSPWRGGKGDMVREFADACRQYQLDMGFYVSPWDRNHPEYGRPAYLEIYRRQLREIYTNYGPAFEAWFDGANGGDGFYGGAREKRSIDHTTYYDWQNTWQIVRDLQPNAAIFSDIGPDLRWVGNEKGLADAESFSSYTPHAPNGGEPAPGFVLWQQGMAGHADGEFYIPPECDVPLRPGWFYHTAEDGAQRTLPQLIDIYLHSVGCGGFLNLGIAPDKRGRVADGDAARLREFKQAVDALFAEPVAARRTVAVRDQTALVEWGTLRHFNLVELAEDLAQGEQICAYRVSVRGADGQFRLLLTGKAVGRRRLKLLPETAEGDALRIELTETRGTVGTLDVGVFMAKLPESSDEGACDPRTRSDYEMLHCHQEGMIWESRFATPTVITGFLFTPDPALPAGTPDRYEAEIETLDGKRQVIAAGEFSNLRANPIPQLVELETPVTAKLLRFRATRMLIPGDALAGQELGIFHTN